MCVWLGLFSYELFLGAMVQSQRAEKWGRGKINRCSGLSEITIPGFVLVLQKVKNKKKTLDTKIKRAKTQNT